MITFTLFSEINFVDEYKNKTINSRIKKYKCSVIGVRYYITYNNKNFELSLNDQKKINLGEITFPKGVRKLKFSIEGLWGHVVVSFF